MKLVNFASLDPLHKKRNVKGLSHVSELDRQIWGEFNSNWERLAFESEQALQKLRHKKDRAEFTESKVLERPTETEAVVRVRVVQRFFRQSEVVWVVKTEKGVV